MTTDRTYRPAVSPELACQALRHCAGGQFDPSVVDAFLAVIADGGEDGPADAAHTAAEHVRTLLAAG